MNLIIAVQSPAEESEMGNTEIVRAFYETLDKSYLSPVVVEITEGFPESGVYRCPDSFFGTFFCHLMAHYSDWNAQPQEFLDVGEKVVVLGTYSATVVPTGGKFSAPFVHTWSLAGGKIVRLQQSGPDLIVRLALEWMKASDGDPAKAAG
jgi:hypothetical protein